MSPVSTEKIVDDVCQGDVDGYPKIHLGLLTCDCKKKGEQYRVITVYSEEKMVSEGGWKYLVLECAECGRRLPFKVKPMDKEPQVTAGKMKKGRRNES